jgi:protein SCO1/2
MLKGHKMKSNPIYRTLLLGVSGALILSIIGLIVIEMAQDSLQAPDQLGVVPDFYFVDQNGNTFGKPQMLGKINIVNFFFTRCKGPCPYMNGKVSELYQKYSTTDQVRFVSISVDPANDSLSVLRNYAARFGVTDSRWLFLRGPLEEVQQLIENGFHLGGELPSLHSTKLVLVDRQGNIRGYYDSFDEASLDLLTVHTRELLRGMR